MKVVLRLQLIGPLLLLPPSSLALRLTSALHLVLAKADSTQVPSVGRGALGPHRGHLPLSTGPFPPRGRTH